MPIQMPQKAPKKQSDWSRRSKQASFWAFVILIPVAIIQLSGKAADQPVKINPNPQFETELQNKNISKVMVEQGLIDEIVTVSEREIEESLLRAWAGLKLALEPTGALPLAAVLSSKVKATKKTALILSGGNADLQLVSRLLSR